MHKELTKLTEEAKNSLSKEIGVAVQMLEKKIKLLATATQEEASAVRKQIDQTDTKFSNSLLAYTEETTDGLTTLHKEIAETRSNLQLETRGLQEQVYRDLETQLGILREKNVSKEALAEMWLELGMRLKDVDLASTLENAAKGTGKNGG